MRTDYYFLLALVHKETGEQRGTFGSIQLQQGSRRSEVLRDLLKHLDVALDTWVVTRFDLERDTL